MEFIPLLDASTERTCHDGLKKNVNDAFQDGFKEGFKNGCEALSGLTSQLRDEIMFMQDIQLLRHGLAESTKMNQKLQRDLTCAKKTTQELRKDFQNTALKLYEDHKSPMTIFQKPQKEITDAEQTIHKELEASNKATTHAIERLREANDKQSEATAKTTQKIQQNFASVTKVTGDLRHDQNATSERVQQLELKLAESDLQRHDLRYEQEQLKKFVDKLRNDNAVDHDHIQYLEAHFGDNDSDYTSFGTFIKTPYIPQTAYDDGTPLSSSAQRLEHLKARLSVKHGHGMSTSIVNGN
ncbi:hypothetical protein GGR57DRAFT_515606 [Xylariaceae sp. FL1272]|nr:hypothetical protein GGR57DRAFT_515606 [Xylariaceae sp. FL1272]